MLGLGGDEPIGGVRRALLNFAGDLRERSWPAQMLCLGADPLVELLRQQGYTVHCLHEDSRRQARCVGTASGDRMDQLAAVRQLQAYVLALTESLLRLQSVVVRARWNADRLAVAYLPSGAAHFNVDRVLRWWHDSRWLPGSAMLRSSVAQLPP